MQSTFGNSINLSKDSIFCIQKPICNLPQSFNDTTKLFYLCKVWGFVNFFSENINSKKIDIDSILINSIPLILQSHDKINYCERLLEIIKSIQFEPSYGKNPFPDISDYSLIDNEWMNDTVCLNNQIKHHLEVIFHGHSGKNSYSLSNNNGLIRPINEKNYKDFNDESIRLLGLFRYWNIINYFYPSKSFITDSWDNVLYLSIPLFRKASNQKDYHIEIYRLTNKLRDTHASIPPSKDYVVFGPYRPLFRMKRIDNCFIINKIRIENTNSSLFKTGDIILKVDNKDVHYLYDSLKTFVGGGNYWSEQRIVCNAILSRRDSVTNFMVLRGSDTLNIFSQNMRVKDLFRKETELEIEKERKPIYKWMNDSIAYLNLANATPQNFKRNLKQIKSAKSIILDLRCYPHPFLILDVLEYFIPSYTRFAYSVYPDYRFPGMLRKHYTTPFLISKYRYKGHLLILVDENTESYSEYLGMLLQSNPKTITVGNSTSGANGNVSIVEFPGEIKTMYSGLGIYYPDMVATQMAGLKIDYPVSPTILSINNGEDLFLTRAIEILSNK